MAWAQTGRLNTEPALPADRLELAASGAQRVLDVSERAALVNLLTTAFQQSNLRTQQPYDLKTAFTAFGTTSSDGIWKLRDTHPAPGIYRWTAEGPSFSVINLFVKNNLLYSNQPSAYLPLRLAQARTAIFFKLTPLGPRASLRSVSASLDSIQLTCALIAYGSGVKTVDPRPRRWEESEYCVEPKSGNLMTYSPVPGVYVLYDYSNAIRFHDKVIPNKFSVTQGGKTVIESQVESLSDLPSDAALFQPNGLNAIGVGPVMTPPWRFNMFAFSSSIPAGEAGEEVALHGMRSPDGRVSDLEVITATNAAFIGTALRHVTSAEGRATTADLEPGVTPQSSEVFYTVHYMNAGTHYVNPAIN